MINSFDSDFFFEGQPINRAILTHTETIVIQHNISDTTPRKRKYLEQLLQDLQKQYPEAKEVKSYDPIKLRNIIWSKIETVCLRAKIYQKFYPSTTERRLRLYPDRVDFNFPDFKYRTTWEGDNQYVFDKILTINRKKNKDIRYLYTCILY